MRDFFSSLHSVNDCSFSLSCLSAEVWFLFWCCARITPLPKAISNSSTEIRRVWTEKKWIGARFSKPFNEAAGTSRLHTVLLPNYLYSAVPYNNLMYPLDFLGDFSHSCCSMLGYRSKSGGLQIMLWSHCGCHVSALDLVWVSIVQWCELIWWRT